MRRDRFAYLLFALVGFTELGVLLLVGEFRFYKGGPLLLLVLVAWLGRRSRTAWWLFLVGNAWLLFAGVTLLLGSTTRTVSNGHAVANLDLGGVEWGHAIPVLLGSTLLLAILLSRSMRTWVRPAATA